MTTKAREYDQEFVNNAVSLALKSKESVAGIARDLGVPKSTLYGWIKQGRTPDHGKNGIGLALDKDVLALKRECAILREERDILKKALGIFSAAKK